MYEREPDEECERMNDNVTELADAVVGHRIVSAERGNTTKSNWRSYGDLVLTLNNGTKVVLSDTCDCCAYTELEEFLLHPESVDHVITGVGTTDDFTTWHIYADMGDVLRMDVGWSQGNPCYYGYGFSIKVEPLTSE